MEIFYFNGTKEELEAAAKEIRKIKAQQAAQQAALESPEGQKRRRRNINEIEAMTVVEEEENN